jgi:hypothetical protein
MEVDFCQNARSSINKLSQDVWYLASIYVCVDKQARLIDCSRERGVEHMARPSRNSRLPTPAACSPTQPITYLLL